MNADIFNQDFEKSMEDFKNRTNEELKEVFKNFIKPSFMIRLKEDIIHAPEFVGLMPKCYNFNFRLLSSAIGGDNMDFDVCMNLSMIHWFKFLTVPEQERGKKYRDNNYISELKRETLTQIQLRQLIQNFEERNFFLAHCPLNFAMHCVVNYLLQRINENLNQNKRSSIANANFKINSMMVMLKSIKSILILTECSDYGSAFVLLRSLIESIFTYMAIYDNEEAANIYYKFMEFRDEYEATGQYPDEFKNLIGKKEIQKQNYLNYGWIDEVSCNKKAKRRYVFTEVAALSKKIPSGDKDVFVKAYKYCCKYAHGNYINQIINPKESLIWITYTAGGILANIVREFSYIFNESVNYNGIDLEKHLINKIDEAVDCWNKIKAEEQD